MPRLEWCRRYFRSVRSRQVPGFLAGQLLTVFNLKLLRRVKTSHFGRATAMSAIIVTVRIDPVHSPRVTLPGSVHLAEGSSGNRLPSAHVPLR